MIIRYAEEKDVQELAKLISKTWKETYEKIMNPKVFEEEEESEKEFQINQLVNRIKNKEAYILVCEVEGKLIAYIDYGTYSDEEIKLPNLSEINAIYILKEHQNMGFGKKLLLKAVEDLEQEGYDKLAIWGLEANKCTNFYKKIGGVPTYERQFEIMDDSFLEIAYLYENFEDLKNNLK